MTFKIGLDIQISKTAIAIRASVEIATVLVCKSKGLLEYRKQALELKLFLLKLTEAIQSRNLPESEDFEVKSKEINLVSDFTKEFFFMENDDSVNIPKFENLANFNRAKKTTP